MASVRGRGRGGGGNGNANTNGGGGGGGGSRGGGPDAANNRRGSWRGGPPGSNGSVSYGNAVRGGNGTGHITPRQSINDHMNSMGKVVVDEKPKTSKGFATDTDISGTTAPQERELKPWVNDDLPKTSGPRQSNGGGGAKDKETFGGEANIPWDQFETNSRLFGTKTSYQEEIYTTKLNKTAPDFEKRKREADRLANEIMNSSSGNSHVAEERNQAVEETKDEEEKFSGVIRNPNAYVPPAARRGGAANASAPRPVPSPTPSATNGLPKLNGSSALPPKPAAASPPASLKVEAPVSQPPARSTSDLAPATPAETKQVETRAATPPPAANTPNPSASAAVPTPTGAAEDKDGQQLGSVVDQFRQFVGTERERAEAKKHLMVKLERDRQLADFKKFQTSFKVPLPMPKDILPLLSKDEEKQKAISAQAETNLQAAKTKPAPTTSPVQPTTPATPAATKKIPMKISEIPPFSAVKRKPPPVPVPEGAKKDIDLGVPPVPSPAPSNGSLAVDKEKEKEKADAEKAKLNPNASTFVFKPNPGAAAFKPGQSSTSSPAQQPAQAQPAAGPSVPKNPFFREQPVPMPKDFNPRDSFNLWKNGQVPAAASIPPQWPFTGRKYNPNFHGPQMQMGMGFDDDPSSPHSGPPPFMQGMPPNFYPNYRFQPGMPQQQMPGQMQGNPMFSPGPQYAPLPGGQNQHMGGPQQPNGMPMYFQNGIPQNPQFLPPQHMHFNPNTPQRPGPGQGGPGPGPGPGPGMYYQHQMQQIPTPQQTPQMHQGVLGPPPPQQQFLNSPMGSSQIPGQAQGQGQGQGQGQFEGQGGGGGGQQQQQQQQH